MPVDGHAGEPPVANPISAQTDAALNTLKAAKGSAGMSALSTALGKLSDSVATSATRESDRLVKITMNRLALNTLTNIFPQVKLPTVNDAIKSINSVLGNTATSDTLKIQKAAHNTSTSPDPSAISSFNDKMMGVLAANSQEKISNFRQDLANVNGLNQAVQGKI